MSLETLLQEVRQRRLILLFGRAHRVILWSPNTRVTSRVRAAIRTYNSELAAMIRCSHIAVCPSAGLHRGSWYYVGAGQYRCQLCAQLFAAVWPQSRKKKVS